MTQQKEKELRKKFVKWHTAEATFAYGVPISRTITDFFIDEFDTLLNEKVAEIEKLLGTQRCENLHHKKSHQHSYSEECPALKELATILKQ